MTDQLSRNRARHKQDDTQAVAAGRQASCFAAPLCGIVAVECLARSRTDHTGAPATAVRVACGCISGPARGRAWVPSSQH